MLAGLDAARAASRVLARMSPGGKTDALEAVAKSKGLPMAQVAMAWLLQKPGITAPIVGVSKMSHLEDAIAALGVTLSDDEVKALEAPYQPIAVTGF